MIKFSFEVPIAHLNEFEEDQDFLFGLSFMLRNQDYFNYFMKECSKEVIIDNSFNELHKPNSVEEMANIFLYNLPKVSKVVSPDYPDWGVFTQLTYALDLVKMVGHRKFVIAPINNPQWLGYYFEGGFSRENIAIGYEFRYLTDDSLSLLKGTHFLGLNSVRELFIGQPRSCDTGMPIKLAKKNLTIPQWVKGGCQHIFTNENFFNMKLSNKQITLAKKNIATLKTIGECIC